MNYCFGILFYAINVVFSEEDRWLRDSLGKSELEVWWPVKRWKEVAATVLWTAAAGLSPSKATSSPGSPALRCWWHRHMWRGSLASVCYSDGEIYFSLFIKQNQQCVHLLVNIYIFMMAYVRGINTLLALHPPVVFKYWGDYHTGDQRPVAE